MGNKAATKGKSPVRPALAAAAPKAGKATLKHSKLASANKPTASPKTKLANAKAVPLPRESSSDQEDRAPTASEEEDDDEDDVDLESDDEALGSDFDEEAFLTAIAEAQAKGKGEDVDMGDAEEDDEEDSQDEGEDSEDVSPEALERMMKLLGDDVSESDIAMLKSMKGEGSDDEDEEDDEEDDEDEDESDEEDDEEVAEALRELEDASDVDADAEDVVPVEETTVNDKAALTRVLASIANPAHTTFFDNLTLVNPQPLAPVDANNDLERELEFYKQSLWAAMHAEKLFEAADLPFHRPSDYFAEMVKTDAHMAKLRQALLDEQAGMKASEDARKLRDAKKFGKKVQQERIREREMEKKRIKEGVEGLKKKRKNGDAFGSTEDFDVALEDALAGAAESGSNKRQKKVPESERAGRGRAGLSRRGRDQKYGYGGGGKRSKENNEREDERRGGGAFGGKRGGGRGGGRGGRGGRGGARGGAAKRPGKSRRQ